KVGVARSWGPILYSVGLGSGSDAGRACKLICNGAYGEEGEVSPVLHGGGDFLSFSLLALSVPPDVFSSGSLSLARDLSSHPLVSSLLDASDNAEFVMEIYYQ
ncbi:hypothetical protein XENOCAPTIV_022087, partial [Xenoophorus captivus]